MRGTLYIMAAAALLLGLGACLGGGTLGSGVEIAESFGERTIRAAEYGPALTGRLLGANGQPLAGATLSVTAQGETQSVVSGIDGSYLIDIGFIDLSRQERIYIGVEANRRRGIYVLKKIGVGLEILELNLKLFPDGRLEPVR